MEKVILKRFLKRIAYFLFLLIIVISGTEICFRMQVFDFYKAELQSLNTKTDKNKKNILIIGDSFSAHPESYVKHLRKNYSQYNVINASVPGTGIIQHNLYFDKRVKEFNPEHIIYQFYVGNDFLDIKRPLNFKEISFIRNIYWMVSEKILFLHYLNRKLAFITSNTQSIDVLQEADFEKSRYNNRVVNYFKGNSAYLNNTIFLEGKQIEVYESWKEKMIKFRKSVPDSVPITLLVIPTCAQTDKTYKKRFIEIGAYLSDDILEKEYPLYLKMAEELADFNIINPLAEFQLLSSEGVELYYKNDPHLTPEGQKCLGNFLIKNLNFKK